ncbi:hypothetical protein ACFUOZ_19525 [Paenarthrobacter sp. NPDC057355]|uniref:hypothetical protein n=1 Tax=Paenarthrobacter sp. NPDC057355 TaxID=3346105 RepID=UPI003645096D
MSRIRITVSQTVEAEQEDLQQAALGFPNAWPLPQDPDHRLFLTSEPEFLAEILGIEIRNHLLRHMPEISLLMPVRGLSLPGVSCG